MTNNIFARTSQQTSTQTISSKKSETAETAGSLALKAEKSYLAMNSYDAVVFSTPQVINVDFSNYSTSEAGTANSGFLSNFANAVAVIGTDCAGGSFVGASAGGGCASSGSCGGGGGGFTSFV